MDSLTPVYPSRLQGKILLPPSKSLSNRALILTAIAGGELSDTTFSDCDDTRVMVAALKDRPETIDIGAAGTAMRFLTAYFAIQKGESHILTGTERMRCRPIGVLVDALRSLGAKISYIYKECFPHSCRRRYIKRRFHQPSGRY